MYRGGIQDGSYKAQFPESRGCRRSFWTGGGEPYGLWTPEVAGKEGASGEQSSNEYDDKSWLGEAPALTPADCEETKECEVLIVGSALSGSWRHMVR